MKEIDLMEVGGFRAGHAQDAEAGTGCTVLLFDGCAPAGVDIRGGGPASRETPLLDPRMDAKGIHALLLSGGSAFGLDAAGGVMRFLEERGIGFDTGVAKVPLVCQSCIFDLAIGRMDVRPDAAMAYRACESASREPLENGCVGGGTGACVGKYRGREYAMKTGIGTYAVQAGEIKVGAVVVLNALGDVFDIDTGEQIAGMRTEDGHGLRSSERELWEDAGQIRDLFTGNTTIGAVLTNGAFGKAELGKIAAMAHNGYARATLSADLNAVGSLAAYVMGKAINRAAEAAVPMFGLPSLSSLRA